MCAKESDPEALYQWVLRWLAYPIQHPGAKMQTTIVIHGPQGTGKNMFFEAIVTAIASGAPRTATIALPAGAIH